MGAAAPDVGQRTQITVLPTPPSDTAHPVGVELSEPVPPPPMKKQEQDSGNELSSSSLDSHDSTAASTGLPPEEPEEPPPEEPPSEELEEPPPEEPPHEEPPSEELEEPPHEEPKEPPHEEPKELPPVTDLSPPCENQENPPRPNTLDLSHSLPESHQVNSLEFQKPNTEETQENGIESCPEASKPNKEKKALEGELVKCIEEYRKIKIPAFRNKKRNWQNDLLKKYEL
ncbi:early nodulin-75-like [Rana temporaria]|uniref:early nodulin-75-like n=1 Tax=Rana temporaria TaxID=8407 RepID=UPI001AAC6E7F|nr:early nodulin-75-like [Rana temporaria]